MLQRALGSWTEAECSELKPRQWQWQLKDEGVGRECVVVPGHRLHEQLKGWQQCQVFLVVPLTVVETQSTET